MMMITTVEDGRSWFLFFDLLLLSPLLHPFLLFLGRQVVFILKDGTNLEPNIYIHDGDDDEIAFQKLVFRYGERKT